MSVWEYKVISSGKGGFATPALMESFLNQLGKEEWEIIHFHTPSDNALAFSGLARRSTQRDWTLEDAVAAAARAEAEKLRTEFEAKFKAAASGAGGGAEDKPETLAAEKANADDGFRKLRDTDRDLDQESEDEPAAPEGEPDEWQKLAKEEELPSFFEAIQPLMRRNQRGAGMSVGVDHLAKKWGMGEDDIMAALKECGFLIPEDEDDPPGYLEYDGDLFWVNVNRRGEVWVNTKEKPRPVFKSVKAAKFTPEVKEGAAPAPEAIQTAESEGEARRQGALDAQPRSDPPSPEAGELPAAPERPEGAQRAQRPERGERRPDRGPERPPGGNQPGKRGLPEGEDLLNRIKPLMRRARGGEGGSGSVGFLSRGLKCRDNELMAAFASMGLNLPGGAGEPASEVVIGDALWWLNKDHRGGIWINARKPGTEKTASSEGSAPAGSDLGGARPPGALAAPQAPSESQAPSTATTEPTETTSSASSASTEPNADGASLPGASDEASAKSEGHAPPTPAIGSGEAWTEAASEEAAIALSSEAPAMPPAVDSGHAPEPDAAAPVASAEPLSAVPALIAQLRPLLKETRTGTLAGEVSKLAEATGQDAAALVASLVSLGLAVPDKPREKPATVDFGGEPVWLSKNAKDELWFNAKPAREAVPERKPKRPKRPAADETTS